MQQKTVMEMWKVTQSQNGGKPLSEAVKSEGKKCWNWNIGIPQVALDGVFCSLCPNTSGATK